MKELKPTNKTVLSGYKRIGKRLVPPIMQLDKLVETSFQNDTLPHLIWIVAIFQQGGERDGVRMAIDFLSLAHKALGDNKTSPLAFLGNFDKIDAAGKALIRSAASENGLLPRLQTQLHHQHYLFQRYPLAFLFDNAPAFSSGKETATKH